VNDGVELLALPLFWSEFFVKVVVGSLGYK